jgi:hypothetical protein
MRHGQDNILRTLVLENNETQTRKQINKRHPYLLPRLLVNVRAFGNRAGQNKHPLKSDENIRDENGT